MEARFPEEDTRVLSAAWPQRRIGGQNLQSASCHDDENRNADPMCYADEERLSAPPFPPIDSIALRHSSSAIERCAGCSSGCPCPFPFLSLCHLL
jgi:hypothetical protein